MMEPAERDQRCTERDQRCTEHDPKTPLIDAKTFLRATGITFNIATYLNLIEMGHHRFAEECAKITKTPLKYNEKAIQDAMERIRTESSSPIHRHRKKLTKSDHEHNNLIFRAACTFVARGASISAPTRESIVTVKRGIIEQTPLDNKDLINAALVHVYNKIVAANVYTCLRLGSDQRSHIAVKTYTTMQRLGRDVIKLIAEYVAAPNDPIYERIQTIDGDVIAATDNTSILAASGRRAGDFFISSDIFGIVVAVTNTSMTKINESIDIDHNKICLIVDIDGAYRRIVEID